MRELKNKFLLLGIITSFSFLFVPLFAQAQFHFEGQVLDAHTNLAVQNFTIQTDTVKNRFNHGFFHFEIQKLPAQIIFTARGYFPFSLFVNSRTEKLEIHLIPENINIQEVTVHAFQSGKRLFDTPGSIDLITHRQIITEPAFTLAPVVNTIPGVWMQSGSMNTNRLTIRGIGSRSPYGSNKIRAYFGDIPLTNGVGETTLEDLDLEQIANIEIIKGPSSGFYGSGLGGVLLFFPSTPTKSEFAETFSMGSYHTLKNTAKLNLAAKNSGHSLIYSHLQSAGYRENNATNRENLTWTSEIRKNKTKVNLLASFIKTNAFIPSSVDLKTFQETPEKAAANWANTRGYEDYTNVYVGISAEQILNKNWLVKISTFGHYNKNNELRPFNILQEKNHFLGLRSVVEKKYISENRTIRLIAGNEYFNENYNWQIFQNNNRTSGSLLSDNQEYRWYNNFFLLTDLNIQEKLMVSASLSYNQTNYNYIDSFLTDGDQGGKHQFKPIISPRLTATWLISEKVRIYSIISKGFSPPTLEETLMPNGQRNSSIKPETGWNIEIGAKTNVGKSLYIELSAYYMKVKNLLVAQRTAEDAYMGINAGASNHPGIEFKLDYQLINQPGWKSYFRMNANLTSYRFSEFVDHGNNYSGNKLTGTPTSTTNWMLETKFSSGIFLNLHYQTVGRIPMRDDNSIFSSAYQLANVMAGYEKSIKNITVSMTTGIQNLLDKHYASMILINASSFGTQTPRYYYPGLPRNLKTSLSLKYSF